MDMMEEMLLPLVSERFRNEPKYREGHIRIVNPLPGRRILGVHVPEMKALAKNLARGEDALGIIRGLEAEAWAEGDGAPGRRMTYEELVVWGLMINYMKVPWNVRAELLRRFVPVLDNWGVCDTFCSNAKWVYADEKTVRKQAYKCTRHELWDFMRPYWRSSDEFEVRFAVVVSMVHFLDEQWFPEVCRMIDALDFDVIRSEYISAKEAKRKGVSGGGVALGEPPYYVRMAVAWLLATALAKMPDRTREYVNASRLPDDVKRLYARKARESFRTRTISPF